MLPVELARLCVKKTSEESQVELMLRVNPNLFWFKGHFSEQPLLPGVAQLDWVMRYAAELLVPGWQFSSIENIKFQQPILPGKTLRLVLMWRADKQWLTFSYHIQEGNAERTASSGKIKLEPATERSYASK
ncbi:3-hydroxyacyl-ACP dehydratase FabZ family protein [Brenneria izbisi]|uniref:Polyketide synthase dehydratase domain-containing protein n=1 Tax=Brenneria izbisi TaxID=2939450 RepID=A0AA41XUS0_9GAMM|nr:polyketide synthase dehydratase domain-containing protein [Brenneria izbisi]MCV9878890.1 polyketide synthase dehydratase domain-containing protein [Brenneria izbisi]MCV9882445.1 polyketide synthase dehydratase domain-containing protein [Brenneria izbisi]